MASSPLTIEELPSGKRRVSVTPAAGLIVERCTWETAYPLPLIEAIYAAKGAAVCDEIMREEDPRYVERSIRKEVFAYIEPERFAGKRILDFGCGAGASTLVLQRMLPPCEICGVELQERLLGIARLRAAHLAAGPLQFLRSPSADSLPEDLGMFDYVFFSALFEHLLAHERPVLLRLVWRHMKPGAILFLNQTPHRWSPFEAHTTFLPLINYLPDAWAHRMALWFVRAPRNTTWEQLLRDGIRGGTVSEILSILRTCGEPVLLESIGGVGDRIDLWHAKLSPRRRWLKRSIWGTLKVWKAASGVEWTPELSLAIRKDA